MERYTIITVYTDYQVGVTSTASEESAEYLARVEVKRADVKQVTIVDNETGLLRSRHN